MRSFNAHRLGVQRSCIKISLCNQVRCLKLCLSQDNLFLIQPITGVDVLQNINNSSDIPIQVIDKVTKCLEFCLFVVHYITINVNDNLSPIGVHHLN